MDTLSFSMNAILPVVLLIFVGYLLKKFHFLEETWFKQGNRLVFRLLLPCLLFYNVYQISSFTAIDPAVVYSELVIFALFFIGLLVAHFAIPDIRQKGVITQCMFRSNFAIIGLTLAEALGGETGVGMAAVLSAFSIPTFNILAVFSLTVFLNSEGEKKSGLKSTLKKIVKNPLILAVVCGLVCLFLRSVLPVTKEGAPVFSLSGNLPCLYSVIGSLAKISSPLALVILGGLFDFSAVKHMLREIIIGTAGRVIFAPLLGIGLAVFLSHTGILSFSQSTYPALVALFGSPVATSSAIMAQEMDNDGTLAGQLVVWTSVTSIFTLFVFIFILRSLSIL